MTSRDRRPRLVPRRHWERRSRTLDPVADHAEILEGLGAHDYPWDTLQALSFALFRTFAVPSIGSLLARTGEFTERVQKRYDDTGLLLEEVSRHGFTSPRGRAAVRRINQMHRRHDISDDDMRYVLSTFVVVPRRWIDDWGFRPMTAQEVEASVHYYRELGRHLGIRDVPTSYAAFERLLDDHERAHFGFDEGARRVADRTLALLTTFPPNHLLPASLVRRAALALMDDPLLDALGYDRPSRLDRAVVRAGMRARARLLRLLPSRGRPKHASDFGWFRSYSDGYDVERLGVHAGCPVAPRPAAGA